MAWITVPSCSAVSKWPFLWALYPTLALFLSVPSIGAAQVITNITSTSGAGNLGTTVTHQAGSSLYNISNGTRPSDGPNLFHSFGDFSVGAGNAANFLNNTALPTSNILGRVTGGNISNIYGTIQTTNFGNANLYLMNPSGIVLGPNASLNVGGSVSFTTAQYMRLFDGVSSANFYANPANDSLANSILAIDSSAFEFLSATPAAYGFLTVPEANATITVQGSALSVPTGQSITLVGGKVLIQGAPLPDGTIQPAHLSAPNGKIQLATAASPGEFDATTLQSFPNVDGTSFSSFGSVSLESGSSLNVSGTRTVFIKGGQLVLSVNDATLNTLENAGPGDTVSLSPGSSLVTSSSGADPGADVQVTVGHLMMNGATISTINGGDANGGNISINATTVALTDGGNIMSSTGTSGSLEGSGNGGNVTIQGLQATSAADLIMLSGGGAINTVTFGAGRGGDVQLTAGTFTMENGAMILTATIDGGGVGGDVGLNVGTASLMSGSSIQSQTQNFTPGSGQGGDVIIRGLQGTASAADSITFSGDSSLLSQTFGSGNGGTVTVTSTALTMDGAATTINSSANDVGRGGDIELNAQQVTLSGGATITTLTVSGDLNAQPGPSLTVRGVQGAGARADSVLLSGSGSGIVSDSFGTARAGDIAVHAKTTNLTEGAVIQAGTPSTTAAGGNVTIDADSVGISSGSRISSQASTSDAGQVTITANTLTLNNGSIATDSVSEGRGGDVVLNVGTLTLSNGTTVNSSTSGTGRAGDIMVTAGQSVTVDSGSSITANTIGQGHAGNVLLNAGMITVTNSSQISTSARTPEGFFEDPSSLTGNAGNITLTTTGNSLIVSNGGLIASSSQTGGNAGTIGITAPSLSLDNAIITTSTSSSGNAGSITAKVDALSLTNGAEMSSSSTGNATGAAGSVIIQGSSSPANSVTVLDSSILTSAANTGKGGSISVDVKNLSLTNAKISASVKNFDNAPGSTDSATVGLGNIDLTGSSMTLTGSTVTTESAGVRNAGDIRINRNVAGDSFEMQKSTVNTSASLSDGGNIEINFNNIFRMTDSVVTSSVGNPQKTDTTGGNIAIDPNNVILQNSQIIAQAFAGTGGNISIVSNVFLADPFSLVDASSALGISGTVDIRSPVSNISGVVGRLPESVLAAQALLRAACAARLAESKVSSFVERGRDHIPIGPDGLLATPYLAPSFEPPIPMSSAQLRDVGSFQERSVQIRRLMGDLTPRVHLLSGDAACQS
jgi:filamentous hemagglutinin family protein